MTNNARTIDCTIPETVDNGSLFGRIQQLAGDISNDNRVDQNDVTLLQMAIETPSLQVHFNMDAMDINRDGKVNAVDLSLLLSLIDGSV